MQRSILNIAHRGFSSEFPENTLLAFEKGMNAGADGFECDLRLSSDGHVVVFHDDDLKRLCGISGQIETSTLKEIKQLKVKGQESIPTLDEMLEMFHTTRINLEIKPSKRPAVIVEEVLRVLAKIQPKGEILFSSFDMDVLDALLVMDPKAKMGKRGVLVEATHIQDLPSIEGRLKPHTWNVPRQILKQRWAEKWANKKIYPLWIWTLDEPDDWRQCIDSKLPIEAIITNRPKMLAEYLKNRL